MTAFDSNPERPHVLAWPWAMLILAIVAFATYWPLLGSQFAMWDDAEQLENNVDLHPPTWSGLADRWARPSMNIYIPLTNTVWFAVASFAGEDPNSITHGLNAWPFKLTNLLAHICTSTIVFVILRKLFPNRFLPLIGAMLYCVHPLQVEAIAWGSGLKDLLLALFGALCLCLYLGDPAKGFQLSTRAHVLAVVSMVCACLSKPTGLVLPAMLVVVDLLIAGRRNREIFGRILPFAIVSVACAAYARDAQPAIKLDVQLNILDRLLVPLHAYAFYVGKLVWPTQLAFDYGMNWNHLIGSTRLVTAWIVPVLIAAACFLWRGRFPLLGAGLLLAVIPIAPVSGVVVFDYSFYSITADHYLVLAMVGVSIALMDLFKQAKPSWLIAGAAVVLLLLAARSTNQSMTWLTQRSTVDHLLTVNPRSFSAYSVLAIREVTESNGDPEKLRKAETYARKSLELQPDYPRSMNMLANVLAAQGRFEEALAEIDKAIAKDPGDEKYHLARAGILGQLRRGPEAIAELRTVLRLEPNNRLAKELVKKWEETVELPASRKPPASAPTDSH